MKICFSRTIRLGKMRSKEKLLSDTLSVLGEAVRSKSPVLGLLTEDGSGEFVCPAFKMRSFSWDDDSPNFVYGNLEVWWHQTSRRITMTEGPDFSYEDLIRILVDCLGSLGY